MKNRMSKGFPSSSALISLVNIIFICTFLCVSGYGEEDNNTKLLEAAKEGNTVLLKQLLDANADVNTKDTEGWTPLMFASKNGHVESMKLLLDAKPMSTRNLLETRRRLCLLHSMVMWRL